MKIKYIALCLLLALVGCQRDEEMEIGQVSVSNERLEASYSSVEISCTFQTNVTIKNVKAYVSTAQDFSSATSYSLTENSKNTFGANIEGLKDASTYYVRYEISNRWSSKMVDDVSEFNTIPYTTPTVQTNEVTDVTYNSAKVGGTIAANGGKEIKECGIVYSTNQNPTTADIKITNGSGLGEFMCNLTDLQDGMTYYARAYAVNAKGTAYGEEVSFTTKQQFVPTIVTTQPTNVAYNSATVGGNVTNDGGAEVTERGIVYATTQNPTTANNKVTNGSGLGEFTCNLTDLQDGTIYYVRAYAVNEKGTAYGNEVSFTTIAKTVATVTTSHAANVSYTSATVGGNVTDDGGTTVTERGICYSTSANPTTANTKITSGSGLGKFTCNLTDLQDGTTYYVRAYAINAKGTSYGEEVSFTTKAKTIATITTKSATNVSYTSATVGGNVTNDGGAAVTERGVCYSTSANPTTANTKITSGSGLGQFTCNLTDLQDGTTYYVRAYAINEKGTAYGDEVSFTTTELKDGEGIENGYIYVDLGLSVKWATMNVGASGPEDYGDYFAWGETEAKSTYYSWSTYKWCNGSATTLTKYNTQSSYGIVDNKTQLDLSDDAARANWGGSWRMPTDAELTELRSNCTWTWITQNGVKGYKVTSKKSGYTNNSIFLPAAGYHDYSMFYSGYGRYWSSSLSTDYPDSARGVYFSSGDVLRSSNSRSGGQSVRPVCP